VSPSILGVDGLSVRYGDARAVDRVSFTLEKGRCLAVLGANGAGKSSLAAAIAGVVPPASGRVTFDGDDVTGWRSHRLARRGMAYVPEGRGLFPHLEVLDNLRVMLRGALPPPAPPPPLDRCFELFPVLGERRRQAAGTLSGGEQQMLALARVLAAPPRLLVADEMSLGLAPRMVDTVFDVVRRARAQGVTVLLVEQYVERALALADDVIVMRRGEIAWQGPAAGAREQLVTGYLGGAAGQ
jgi:branched-chain amino acid transport system ATP-binding protein